MQLSNTKLIVTAAELLGCIAATIGGMATDNEWLSVVGVICGVLSGALYKFTRMKTDVASINADTTQTVKTVTATTSTAKTVEKLAGIQDGTA